VSEIAEVDPVRHPRLYGLFGQFLERLCSFEEIKNSAGNFEICHDPWCPKRTRDEDCTCDPQFFFVEFP
jgi:hypothetical protein